MSDARPMINPFELPSDWASMRPLCPWLEPGHREYYVPVDSTEVAFEQFVREMADLTKLRRDGQLVLVTGDTGCGKSALVNRCADWVADQLTGQGFESEVLDLTAALLTRPELTTDERMSTVCDQLFGELIRRQLMRKDAMTAFAADREVPVRIYPNLPEITQKPTVLIILLPHCELKEEVIGYASLARGRVLFFMESSALETDDVDTIVHQLERWNPPITLSVGELSDGDVVRYAADRLQRHAALGDYPRMTEDTMELLTGVLESVGEMQRILHGVYKERLSGGAAPGEVSFKEIMRYRRQVVRGKGAGHAP